MTLLIKDIYYFLTTGKTTDAYFNSNLKLLFDLYIIKAGLLLFFVFINLYVFDSKLDGNIEGLHRQGFFKDFINFLILAPILEEILCRLHINLKVRNIIFSIIATCILFYDQIWFLVFLILYFTILILISSLNNRVNNLIFVYISAFIFGISHLAYRDISFSHEEILSLIYIFTPRFLGGLIYSYIFFKKGIHFCIILHFLWNLPPFIINQLAN
ncbi:CPBP family glutamic-type intramembrane protease [Algoriphagus boritolerans]|uniref:CAAX protease self-immunity n=1 Tax=Algoriphagus boritolerans DSM 17298 = JCM 18970 TaxID=1120964 RepID=A0A1H5VY49_9BACT|nr:CAAX protease self-immunity [Algoriphagus boritolerans DSM 17298 = JCM 18970]